MKDITEKFTTHLKDVLTRPELRERLSRASLARARQFSWRRTAEATLRVYEETVRLKSYNRPERS